jgi:hypothetical protein
MAQELWIANRWRIAVEETAPGKWSGVAEHPIGGRLTEHGSDRSEVLNSLRLQTDAAADRYPGSVVVELGPHNSQPHIRRLELAELLWEYGEEPVAEAIASFSQSDLDAVCELAAWHALRDFETGQDREEFFRGDKYVLAAIEFVEGSPRMPKRKRRRTRPLADGYLSEPIDPDSNFGPTHPRSHDPDDYPRPSWFGPRCFMQVR